MAENRRRKNKTFTCNLYFYGYIIFPDVKGILFLYKDHWKSDLFLGSSIGKIMSYNKYYLLDKFLHLSDNKINGADKTLKYKRFYNMLKRNWNIYLRPGTHLTLDEGVAPFIGISSFKQYMPAKPEKWGLKVYKLADSATNYVLSADLYTGSNETSSNYTIKLVLKLLNDYLWKGHRVFLDSYYCCPHLIQVLYFRDTFVTGMTRNNRVGMPKNKLKDLELAEGGLKSFSNDLMHLDVFKDKKRILLMKKKMEDLKL